MNRTYRPQCGSARSDESRDPRLTVKSELAARGRRSKSVLLSLSDLDPDLRRDERVCDLEDGCSL